MTTKTYSHLASARRIPTEYEITSTDLLYHRERGLEIDVPLVSWSARHRRSPGLACDDWGRFADPRQTTYATYTRLQRDQEAHVDGVLRSIDDARSDATLSMAWLTRLDGAMSPLRFVFHGMQMLSAYVGQTAPTSRVTITSRFQAADALRRVQRIAYLTAQMRRVAPELGSDTRSVWEKHAAWQPLRRAIERSMVTYDFGEAFAGHNLVLAPMLDDVVMNALPALATRHGDARLEQIFYSFRQDGRWHRAWAAAFARAIIEDRADNRGVLRDAVDRLRQPALDAVDALAGLFTDDAAAASAFTRDVVTRYASFLRDAGVES